METAIKPPKICANIFKAIAGALFMDSRSLDEVWKIYQPMLEPEFSKFLSFVQLWVFFNMNSFMQMIDLLMHIELSGMSPTSKLLFGVTDMKHLLPWQQ